MDKWLAESKNYKVTSSSEDVYLNKKNLGIFSDLFQGDYIASHYGDPEGAMISKDESYVVVVGHGISIYPIVGTTGIIAVELFNGNDDKALWTNGVHQEQCDQDFDTYVNGPHWLWFNFSSFDDNDDLIKSR